MSLNSGISKIFKVYLDKVRTGERIDVSGRFIRISDASSSLVSINIAIEENAETRYNSMKKDGAIKVGSGFSAIYIKNDAQAGGWVNLIISDGPEDFDVYNPSMNNIDSISEPVMTKGGASCNYGAVTVTDVVTPILYADNDRTGWMITNNDTSNTIYIGTSNTVSTATGTPIAPGEKLAWDGRHDIYGICAPTKTANIRYMDQGAV